MHKLNKPVFLSLASAVLLIAAWPPLPTAFLLAIAFVPVFMVYEHLKHKSRSILKFWLYSCLTMLLFNTGTTWWVWNASPSGCLMMLFANTLIMATPFLLYALTMKAMPKVAPFAFIVYYLAMEYFHFNWNAPWPWLTLGKGLAAFPGYIQWYEYTGEFGGSALLLTLNILVYKAVYTEQSRALWLPAGIAASMGLLSVICSLKQPDSNPKKAAISCVVSQPNIDPYTEKFTDGENYISPEDQIKYAIEPAMPLMTDETDLLLFPETAVVGGNNEAYLNHQNLLFPLRYLTDSQKLCIITGAETYTVYDTTDRPSVTARYDSFSEIWYDYYNTALLVSKNAVRNKYHKAKLVAGVEKMPFDFLEKLSINLGGTSGSLGSSSEPVNFSLNNGIQIAPLICYESIFGDYACEFVNKGANVLAVITNDGWWGNSPGYKQHLLYGAIRCIETRREMIRSANTGVSAHIDAYGHIKQPTGYRERTAFACSVQPYSSLTFYVRNGNLIGKTASLMAVLLLLSSLVRRFPNKRNF